MISPEFADFLWLYLISTYRHLRSFKGVAMVYPGFSIGGNRLKIKLHVKLRIESKNWNKHRVSTEEVLKVLGGYVTFTRAGEGFYKKGRYRIIGFSDRFLTIYIDKIRGNEYDLVSARPSKHSEKNFYGKELNR